MYCKKVKLTTPGRFRQGYVSYIKPEKCLGPKVSSECSRQLDGFYILDAF